MYLATMHCQKDYDIREERSAMTREESWNVADVTATILRHVQAMGYVCSCAPAQRFTVAAGTSLHRDARG